MALCYNNIIVSYIHYVIASFGVGTTAMVQVKIKLHFVKQKYDITQRRTLV
jgi:hypothetical protein